MEQFTRTKMLIGEKGLDILQHSRVIVFGVGGVGSYTVEALARAGIGSLFLVDYDSIDITNINRQLPALYSTLGKAKVDVVKERILDINPRAQVYVYKEKVSTDNISLFYEQNPSYVVDAIDMVSGKIAIIETALQLGIPIVSAMGAGNRRDPTKIMIGDISETVGSGCSLARIMRRELRKRGIAKGVRVVYSTEKPEKCRDNPVSRIPGSISFVPSVAGLFLAAEVVNNLLC